MNIEKEYFLVDLKDIVEKIMYDEVQYNKRFGNINQCYGIGQNAIPKIALKIVTKISNKYNLDFIQEL